MNFQDQENPNYQKKSKTFFLEKANKSMANLRLPEYEVKKKRKM